MKQRSWVGLLSLAAVMMPSSAIAQITSDQSTGTTVTPNGNVYNITGGTTVGDRNLFHSFDRFDVPDQGIANFLNDSSIVNIFSRVTGGKVSEINGILRSRGSANFFLMNPSGTVFGPNASLNVEGSFVATTATAIQFPSGAEFSLTSSVNSQNDLLKTDPSAFLLNQTATQQIINNSNASTNFTSPLGTPISGLRVPDGRSLLLIGGNISMDGGRLNALGGRIELGGLAGAGVIGLQSNGNTLSLSFPQNSLRANVTLANDARVAVRGSGGGNIIVNANTFTATAGGRLVGGIETGGKGGNIIVNSSTLSFSGIGRSTSPSGIFQQALSPVLGDTGDISVQTNSFNMSEGSEVQNSIRPNTQGNAGKIHIVANSISLRDNALVNSSTFGQGRGGDITLTTNTLTVDHGARLIASTFGRGDAGNVNLNVLGATAFDGVRSDGSPSVAASEVGEGAVGRGGNITLNTDSLRITSGARLSNSTFGEGNAGDINISARGDIVVDGKDNLGFTAIASEVEGFQSLRQGGNITINANSLFMRNGGSVSASIPGKGYAGNVKIIARDTISLDGASVDGDFTAIYSLINRRGEGSSGNVIIEAKNLSLTNGGRLSASTLGRGNAGNVIINVQDSFNVSGRNKEGIASGALSAVAEETGEGDGGSIIVNTGSLTITSGAALNTSTFFRGNAGSISVTARDFVSLSGQDTFILSQTGADTIGKGGDITIVTPSLRVDQGAQLNVATRGTGKAGNITITALDDVIFKGFSQTSENTFPSGAFSIVDTNATGKGGDIKITARSLAVVNGAGIYSDARGQGAAGNIFINTSQGFKAIEGQVISSAQQFGGGNIDITSQTISLRNNSDIKTNLLTGQGSGGNITLTADSITALDDSDILAFARDGRGGNITLNTRAFFGQNYRPAPLNTDPRTLDRNGSVDVNASGTVSGIITIPDTTFIQNSLTQLPQTAIDTNNLLANSCIARNPKNGSFYITGTSGLPANPSDRSDYPTGTIQPTWKRGDPIIEPQGVYPLPNGQLVMSRDCDR